MDTILNPITVPGWEQLQAEHPTRALVLRALTNLELDFYIGQRAARPTRKQILTEAIALGADISTTSVQTVQRHLDALAEAGHVIKAPSTGSGQAGKSPWRSRYLLLPDPTKE